MKVHFAAGYRVPPGKDMTDHDIRAAVVGSELALKGPVAQRVDHLIQKAMPRPIEVAFPSTDQTHPVRELVVALARLRSAEASARELAVRLSAATDHRSHPGLFLVVVVPDRSAERAVHLWRFSAEQNLIANFRAGHLDVEVLEEGFAAGNMLFKAARFRGRPDSERAFWAGEAEDRQAKLPGAAASAYWIEEFLGAKLAVTPTLGSQVLAEAIAAVVKKTKDPQVQSRLISGALALFNAAGERLTFEAAVRRLPREVRKDTLDVIAKTYPPTTLITIDQATLVRGLGLREVHLDTGVVVAGPNSSFDRVVKQRDVPGGGVELRTQGEVVQTKIKRGRAEAG